MRWNRAEFWNVGKSGAHDTSHSVKSPMAELNRTYKMLVAVGLVQSYGQTRICYRVILLVLVPPCIAVVLTWSVTFVTCGCCPRVFRWPRFVSKYILFGA